MEQTTKDLYLKLISDIDSDLEMVFIIKEFIETYEGPETEQLHKLLIGAINMCVDVDLLETKADAYDELAALKEQTNAKYEEVMTAEDEESDISIQDIIVPVSDLEGKKDETQ